MKKRPATLNPHQRIVAKVYGMGDYSHLKRYEECSDVGDGLFTFIIRELSDCTGKGGRDTAIQRMYSAIADIEVVLAALEKRT